MVEQAETAAEVDRVGIRIDSVSDQSNTRTPEPRSLRRVSEGTGIPVNIIKTVRQRVAAVEFYLYLAATLTVIRRLINEARTLYRWPTRPTTRRLK